MNRELQYGDPVLWPEVQMRHNCIDGGYKPVTVHRRGRFLRRWEGAAEHLAVVETKSGHVINIAMTQVALDEEALAKRKNG